MARENSRTITKGDVMDVENVWDIALAVMLAGAGGLARLFSLKDETKLNLSRICSELLIAGFTGLMALFVARASGLTGDWIGLVCGMAGWIGPKFLDVVMKPLSRILNMDANGKEAKDVTKND
jgi:hypothetical protein